MAKILAFSDIHGNYEAMNAFSRGLEGLSRKSTLFLGDGTHFGFDYKENLVLDLLAGIPEISCCRGNHCDASEDVSDWNPKSKLSKENVNRLRIAPEYILSSNVLAFHSSLANPGRYLRTPESIENEAEYLLQSRANLKFVLFGHTHQRACYSYDPSTKRASAAELSKKIRLEEGKVYFINPGNIGFPGQEHTFAILDTSKREVMFYTLEELQNMDVKKRAIWLFEDLMPHLKGDNGSYETLGKQAQELQKLNRGSILDNFVGLLSRFSPPKAGRKKYYDDFTLALAKEASHLATLDVKQNYSIPDALQIRKFVLRH